MAKRSWFGGLMGMEQEHHFVMVRDKTFSQVKADLVHAFLSVSTTIALLLYLLLFVYLFILRCVVFIFVCVCFCFVLLGGGEAACNL